MQTPHEKRPRREIGLLGLPVDAGAGVPGASMGPAALRIAGLAKELQQLGHNVEDFGDVAPQTVSEPAPENCRNFHEIAGWTRAASKACYALASSGRFPIFLGGDHSMAMGTVNAMARHAEDQGRELFVLWLDAHADYNTPATSPSGNLHGMPVAVYCGEPGFDAIFGDEPRAKVKPENVHLFGIRSIDREEYRLIDSRGIKVYDMRLIDEFSVGALMRKIIEEVSAKNGLLHVSLDIDFLDPTIAPAVGTTVSGGATYREAHLIMEMLHDSGLVSSLDIAELNPFLDVRGQSSCLLVEMLASLFGRRIMDRTFALPMAS
jgi:arginase